MISEDKGVITRNKWDESETQDRKFRGHKTRTRAQTAVQSQGLPSCWNRSFQESRLLSWHHRIPVSEQYLTQSRHSNHCWINKWICSHFLALPVSLLSPCSLSLSLSKAKWSFTSACPSLHFCHNQLSFFSLISFQYSCIHRVNHGHTCISQIYISLIKAIAEAEWFSQDQFQIPRKKRLSNSAYTRFPFPVNYARGMVKMA